MDKHACVLVLLVMAALPRVALAVPVVQHDGSRLNRRSVDDTAGACRALEESDAPENGGLVCVLVDGETQVCSPRCNPGYGYISEPPEKVCGPATHFQWQPQEDGDSLFAPCVAVCRQLTGSEAPPHGGVVCVTLADGTRVCAPRCDPGFEHPGRSRTISCGPTTMYEWSPQLESEGDTWFLPCIEQLFPGVQLEAETSYFPSECATLSDTELSEVRQEEEQEVCEDWNCEHAHNTHVICHDPTETQAAAGPPGFHSFERECLDLTGPEKYRLGLEQANTTTIVEMVPASLGLNVVCHVQAPPTSCRELEYSDAPEHGGLVCVHVDDVTRVCSPRCNPGFEFVETQHDVYCGPLTGFQWPQTGEGPLFQPCQEAPFPGVLDDDASHFTTDCQDLTEEERTNLGQAQAEVTCAPQTCSLPVHTDVLCRSSCREPTPSDPPVNGGFVCVDLSGDRRRCSPRCNPGYEFPDGAQDHVCGPATGFQWPSQADNAFPACIEEFFPGVHLENEMFYFSTSCSEMSSAEQDTQVTEYGTSACQSEIGPCSATNGRVICGSTS